MKRSTIVTSIGIMVFFIASFSSFFVLDSVAGTDPVCMPGLENGCAPMSDTVAVGFYIIASLMIMVVLAAYVMLKNFTGKGL